MPTFKCFLYTFFRGDGNDKYLNQIIKVLEHLKNREDIRPCLLKINNVKKHISEVDFDTWFNYLHRQYERKNSLQRIISSFKCNFK